MIISEKTLSMFIKFTLLANFIVFYSFAGEGDTYKFKWLDPKKQVYVLQNKIHPNKGRFYLNAGYGTSSLSKFNDSNVIHANLGVYFSEEWGLEGIFSMYNNRNNEAYITINEQVKEQTGKNAFPHVVKLNQLYGLNLVYSPFYGKINTFNTIFYIDWSFAIGAAFTSYDHNTELIQTNNGGATEDVYETDSAISGILKTQLRWHLNETLKISLEYVGYFTPLPDLEDVGGAQRFDEAKKIINSQDVVLSLGVMF